MNNNNNKNNIVINKEENKRFSIIESVVSKDKKIDINVFNKSERLSIAVHLISNLLSNNEPIKNRLKILSVELTSLSVFIGFSPSYNYQERTKKIISILFELSSLFNIIGISKLVSEMNCEILKKEINNLLEIIVSKENEFLSDQNIIPIKLFDIQSEKIFSKKGDLDRINHKGQKDIKDRETSSTVPNKPALEDKNKRQEIILDMLRKDSNLSVKDFVKNILGCSEKTVQRELINLVSKGLVKKDGERRWSRYSIV